MVLYVVVVEKQVLAKQSITVPFVILIKCNIYSKWHITQLKNNFSYFKATNLTKTMNFGAQRDLKLSARLQNERKEVKTIIKGAKTIACIGIK